MGVGTNFNNYLNDVNAINPMINPYMAGISPMMGGLGSQMFGGGLFGGMMNPAIMNGYQNFENTADMKAFNNSRLDDAASDMYASGQGRISQKAYMVAQQLKGALDAGNGTEVRKILEGVQGDSMKLAGIERAYGELSGDRLGLRRDMRSLDGSKTMSRFGLGALGGFMHKIKVAMLKPFGLDPISESEAFNIINEGAKVNTTVAANALKEATEGGLGLDKNTVNYVMANTGGRMAEIAASYGQMGNLSADIRSAYNPFLDGFAQAEGLNAQIANELV